MALYRGYAEARLGTAPWRRFLLDFDLSLLGRALDAEPAATAVVNHLDLEPAGAAPRAPDLRIQVLVRRAPPLNPETVVEIRFRPEEGRTLTRLEVRAYIDLDQNVFPLSATSGDPGSFGYLGYTGAPGERAPPEIRATLERSTVTTAAAPVDRTAIAVRLPLDVPRKLDGGLLEGPVRLEGAYSTTLAGGVYSETFRNQIRTASPLSPSGTLLSLRLTDPAPTPAPRRVRGKVFTPHAPEAPLSAPGAVAGAGGGNVTPGSHVYSVTYVAQNGAESGTGPPSAPVALATPSGVTLANVPVAPAAPAGDPGMAVTARRIYRTLASPSGDAGEFFQVGEIADNTSTTFTDLVADRPAGPATLPGQRPATTLFLVYEAERTLDVDGGITLRSPAPGVPPYRDQTFDAELQSVPLNVTAAHDPRATGPDPRFTWWGDAELGSAVVRSRTLAGRPYAFMEAHARRLPREVGAHWSLEGDARTRIELGSRTLGMALPEPADDLAVVLASAPRPWRDAPQTVCVEVVDRKRDDGAVESARMRVGVRGLRRARLALGEAGRHARWDDGLKADLELGPDRLGTKPREGTHERALRLLQVTDVPRPGGRDRSRLSVRAGVLPDQLRLDLRNTAAPAGSPASAAYLGLELRGQLRRVKMLSLEDPATGAEAWDADGLRIFLAVPATGPRIDFVSTRGDAVLQADPQLFAEAAVRNPRGIDQTANPIRVVKAVLSLPATVRVTPPIGFVPGRGLFPMRTTYTTAGAGSTAGRLVSGDGLVFDSGWAGGSVRFDDGTPRGMRRRIMSVETGGAALQIDPLPTAPAAGAPFVVERFNGTTNSPGIGGLTVETAALPDAVAAISGRVAVLRDFARGIDIGGRQTDRLLATRATPQVGLRGSRSGFQAATVRVLGVERANATLLQAGEVEAHVALDRNRVNKAFRAQARELDSRFAASERTALRARIARLPPDVMARTDTGPAPARPVAAVELRLSQASGEGVFWAEPGSVRDALAGARAGEVAGVGILEGSFEALPRALRLSILANRPPRLPVAELAPRNFTLPTGWIAGGFKIELSDRLALHFLRMISWSRDRPIESGDIPFGTGVALEADGLISLWGRTDATFLTIAQMGPPLVSPVLDPLFVWTLQERPPVDPSAPGGGLGFRIGEALRVTLDANIYEKKTLARSSRWNRLGTVLGDWELTQELQMQDYRGEVTVATPLGISTAGDQSAGPGRWFLRALDSLPWFAGFGSVYFGNTGGNFQSRPRIFA